MPSRVAKIIEIRCQGALVGGLVKVNREAVRAQHLFSVLDSMVGSWSKRPKSQPGHSLACGTISNGLVSGLDRINRVWIRPWDDIWYQFWRLSQRPGHNDYVRTRATKGFDTDFGALVKAPVPGHLKPRNGLGCVGCFDTTFSTLVESSMAWSCGLGYLVSFDTILSTLVSCWQPGHGD